MRAHSYGIWILLLESLTTNVKEPYHIHINSMLGIIHFGSHIKSLHKLMFIK